MLREGGAIAFCRAAGRSASTRAALIAALIASCASPHQLEWEIDHDPASLEGSILAYRYAVFEGGCPADPDAEAFVEAEAFRDGQPSAPAVELGPSRWGFLVDGRDRDCGVVASGCADVTLPIANPPVVTVLRPASRGAACARSVCVEGRCAVGDAAVPDASQLDASQPDASQLDASQLDASQLDGAAPDALRVDAGPGCVPRPEAFDGHDQDCDGLVDEGWGSLAHCGALGRACEAGPHEHVACVDGECVRECDATWGDCSATRPGCETDLTSQDSCGRCRNDCPEAAMSADDDRCVTTATGGVCRSGRTGSNCRGGRADIDFATTATHCGGCDNPCPDPPNTVPTCVMRECGSACYDGGPSARFADCDADPSNGCETLLSADAENCGACGVACGPCERCHEGGCVPAPDATACDGGVCVDGACCAGCVRDIGPNKLECEPAGRARCGGQGGGGRCDGCGPCQACLGGGRCVDVLPRDAGPAVDAGAAADAGPTADAALTPDAGPASPTCGLDGPPGTCHGASCCAGCFADGVCQAGDRSRLRCGRDGALCVECGAGESCVAGLCER